MSLKCTSRDALSGTNASIFFGGLRCALASALLLGIGGVVGCQPYPTMRDVPVNCAAEDGYQFDPIDTFDTPGPPIFGAGDTPDASVTVAVETLADGPRCGSTSAAVFHTFHNNNWGSLFGFYSFGLRDESAYQGLSFWARAPGNTTKGFTILLDDANTTYLAKDSPALAAGSNCLAPPDAGAPGSVMISGTDPATGTVYSSGTGAAAQPDWCGNGYSVQVVVTTAWRFYTIPFSLFQQTNMPNRVPNAKLTETGSLPETGLLTSKLLGLTLRMQREATMDLWLDNLGFYRKKQAGAGADAGADANAGSDASTGAGG